MNDMNARSGTAEPVTMVRFIEEVCRAGEAGARVSYANPRDAGKLKGALEGFAVSRTATPLTFEALLIEANRKAEQLMVVSPTPEQIDAYWEARCCALEIEWVMNCVSAVLVSAGKRPLAAHLPTARGMMQAKHVMETLVRQTDNALPARELKATENTA
jgi:hypothetical protein